MVFDVKFNNAIRIFLISKTIRRGGRDIIPSPPCVRFCRDFCCEWRASFYDAIGPRPRVSRRAATYGFVGCLFVCGSSGQKAPRPVPPSNWDGPNTRRHAVATTAGAVRGKSSVFSSPKKMFYPRPFFTLGEGVNDKRQKVTDGGRHSTVTGRAATREKKRRLSLDKGRSDAPLRGSPRKKRARTE